MMSNAIEKHGAAGAGRRHATPVKTLVWMTDTNDVIIYLSRSIAHLFELGNVLSVTMYARFIHPDDQARVIAILSKAKELREECQTDYRVLAPDGKIRWVTGSAAPRFGDDDEFLGYAGALIDVTEHYEALERLAKSEASHRLLTENSLDLISHHAADTGVYRYASPSFQRVLGYAPAELVGQASIYGQAHPEDVHLIHEEIQRQASVAGDSRLIEFRVRHKDGHMIWVGTNVKLLVNPATNEKIGSVAVWRDISREVEIAEKLAQLAQENKALLENSLDIIALLDRDGRFLRLNAASFPILGYQPEELLGRPYADLLDPDEAPRVRAVDAGLRTGQNTVQDLESRWRRKDGRIIHLSLALRWSDHKQLMYATARDVTERYRAQDELRRSKVQVDAILESIGDAFFALNRDWRITYANRKACAFAGVAHESAIGARLTELVPYMASWISMPHCRQAMDKRQSAFFESYWEPSASWVEVRIYPSEDGISVYFHDITAKREAQKKISDSERRFREVIEMTPAGYLLADADGDIIDVNPALCYIAGYSRAELIGAGLAKLFFHFPWEGAAFTVYGPVSAHGMEAVIRHKDGRRIYVLFNGSIKRDSDGRVQLLTGLLTDITGRKEAESRLEQLATHDTLTGLPNRALLNDRLQQMLDSGPRNMPIAIMFIDLDRFKEVNDSFGHESGDVLLREVARRLRRALRPNDVIARLGGDEFVVVAYCSAGEASAVSIAEKLLGTLAMPVDIGHQEVVIGASIGISMYPDDARTKELLFQSADTAMYRAKAGGRNSYRFFEAEMTVEAKTRMALELSLRHALGRQEFALHYQPRIDLRAMSIVGMEALIRWNHPGMGQVSPLQFIPIAEDSGRIESIGLWVLEEACVQARRLMEKFSRPLCVSVNLSARQLKCHAIVEQVRAALHKAGLPPSLLELELTESALIENIEHSARLLKELKGLGIRLAVDDFGTGYSGLAYLRRFPLDVLKLDRSFVLQQDDDDRNFDFIKAFVDMAHALKLSVVAEGVETSETLQFLRNAACDEAQGYFLARPLALGSFEDYLSRLPGSSRTPDAA